MKAYQFEMIISRQKDKGVTHLFSENSYLFAFIV